MHTVGMLPWMVTWIVVMTCHSPDSCGGCSDGLGCGNRMRCRDAVSGFRVLTKRVSSYIVM